MDVRDYKGEDLLNGGMLYGLGMSVIAHMAVLLMVVSLSWMMPARDVPLPLCTVNLLTLGEPVVAPAGGNAGPNGNAAPEPAPASEGSPADPEPEALSRPEPEEEPANVVHVPEKIEAPPPALKPVVKPEERPKTKPRPKPGRSKVTEMRAKRENSDVGPSRVEAESSGAADGPVGGTTSGDGPGGGSSASSGAAQGPVDASFGSGDGPRFISRLQPNYPRLARELGKQGTVLLRLTIDERGALTAVEVLKSAGSGFDEEAVRSIKGSRFGPAKRNGKPVACRAVAPIRFVLTRGEDD